MTIFHNWFKSSTIIQYADKALLDYILTYPVGLPPETYTRIEALEAQYSHELLTMNLKAVCVSDDAAKIEILTFPDTECIHPRGLPTVMHRFEQHSPGEQPTYHIMDGFQYEFSRNRLTRPLATREGLKKYLHEARPDDSVLIQETWLFREEIQKIQDHNIAGAIEASRKIPVHHLPREDIPQLFDGRDVCYLEKTPYSHTFESPVKYAAWDKAHLIEKEIFGGAFLCLKALLFEAEAIIIPPKDLKEIGGLDDRCCKGYLVKSIPQLAESPLSTIPA